MFIFILKLLLQLQQWYIYQIALWEKKTKRVWTRKSDKIGQINENSPSTETYDVCIHYKALVVTITMVHISNRFVAMGQNAYGIEKSQF